jgi:hypothetical protein
MALVSPASGASAAGKSLAAIAGELNRDKVVTAHGGARWYPSTVRAVLAAE